MSKSWRPIPITLKILDALKNLGSCDDSELLRNLKKEEITIAELNKALLQLEIRGHITVSNATKGRRKIELRK